MNSASTHAPPACWSSWPSQYTSTITIEKNGKTCDMRKLMAVMGMGIRQGETITVTAEGEDEAAAIEAVEKFLTENV